MALLRYKPGQGYYTRTLSFFWFLTLAMAMGGFLWQQLKAVKDHAIYWQSGALVGVAFIFIPLLYWIINKPKIADFMIATEQEMRKVNWPTRKEIVGSTVVVIGGTLLFAALLFVIDIAFASFFSSIGILKANDPAAGI